MESGEQTQLAAILECVVVREALGEETGRRRPGNLLEDALRAAMNIESEVRSRRLWRRNDLRGALACIGADDAALALRMAQWLKWRTAASALPLRISLHHAEVTYQRIDGTLTLRVPSLPYLKAIDDCRVDEVIASRAFRERLFASPIDAVLGAWSWTPRDDGETFVLTVPEPPADAGAPSDAPATAPAWEAYPVERVEELEHLTRLRAKPPNTDSPADIEKRDQRIARIAGDLSRYRLPASGDMVLGVRLDTPIGRGNFGVVWRGRHEKTGETRAVKLFDPHALGQKLALYHFRRGVRAMAKLEESGSRQAGIVRFYEADATGLAFTMQCAAGGDLTTIARRSWTREKKLSVFDAICRAVRFAHDSGVIHRDLKPANIVIDSEGNPLLTDFDIADLIFANTLSAQAAGTPCYAAPEQFRGSGDGGPPGDVYSLGRLLYFLLLERDPDMLVERVPPLDELKDEPPGLVRVVRKCTLFDPKKRYPTVAALQAELARAESAPGEVGCGPGFRVADPDSTSEARAKFDQAVAFANKKKFESAIAAAESAIAMVKGIDDALYGDWSRQLIEWKARSGDGEAFGRVWRRKLLAPLPIGVTASIVIAASALGWVVSTDTGKEATRRFFAHSRADGGTRVADAGSVLTIDQLLTRDSPPRGDLGHFLSGLRTATGATPFGYHLMLRKADSDTLIGDGGSVHDGDRLGIALIAAKDADLSVARSRYVYVFSVDSLGAVTRLFPGRNQASDRLIPAKALREIILGPPDAFRVSATYGADSYILLTSSEPLSDEVSSGVPAGEWSVEFITIRSVPR